VLVNPLGAPGELDLHPRQLAAVNAAEDLPWSLPDSDRDFDGIPRHRPLRGAYASIGPGWHPDLTPRPPP
jgi:hypothetical protein